MRVSQAHDHQLVLVVCFNLAHSWHRPHVLQTCIRICGCSNVMTSQAPFVAIARWSVSPGSCLLHPTGYKSCVQIYSLTCCLLNTFDKLAVRKCHKNYASHPLVSTVCAYVQDIAQLVQSAADEDDDDDEEEEESPAKPSQARGGKKGKPAAAVSSSYRKNPLQLPILTSFHGMHCASLLVSACWARLSQFVWCCLCVVHISTWLRI